MTRPVGICCHCGGPLLRLAVEGELPSCDCGKSSIPEAVLVAARQMNPRRHPVVPEGEHE